MSSFFSRSTPDGSDDEADSADRGGNGIPPYACRTLGRGSGSKKRKAAVIPTNFDMMGNEEDHDVLSEGEESSRISKEIKNLRFQLARKKEQLRYSQENKKLKAELDLKTEVVTQLFKQTEELKAQNEGLQNNLESEMALKVKVMEQLIKQNEALKAQNESLQNNMLETLNSQAEAKNRYFLQLERWKKSLELSNAQLEEKIRNLDEGNNKDQDIEMPQAALEDEHCFSLDMLSLSLEKYFETNKELQDARKELIHAFRDMAFRRTAIAIKQMGELPKLPFKDACRRMYANSDGLDDKAAMLVSSWQEELKNPSWHPFKIVEVNGQMKQVVDEDDEKLKLLRLEYGDDVCEAVKTAAIEINEHNPSGGYIVSELWHMDKGRKATAVEALRELVKELRSLQWRRRRAAAA